MSQKYTPEAIAERRHELERMEQLWAENRNLRTMNAKLAEALEKLARLGNEPYLGNSDGNRIAQAALAAAKEVEDD